jgi:hypothetical protein
MSSRSKSATINVVLSDSGSESIGEDHRVSSWPQRPWRFVAQLVLEITEHHTLLIASGVAFSAVLGLIPALVGVVSVYGLVASPEDVGSNLAPLTTALPEEAADLVVNQLRNLTAISGSQVTIGVVVGLFGVMWQRSQCGRHGHPRCSRDAEPAQLGARASFRSQVEFGGSNGDRVIDLAGCCPAGLA